MQRATIEQLESRQLLTSVISTVGTPVTVATVPGQFAPLASCPIGQNGDVLVAYINSSKVVIGTILTSSEAVKVAPFNISNGEGGYIFTSMAAVEDSNGNAVLAYTGSNGNSLYLARISDAGTIVNQPSLVSQSTDAQNDPALAIGANNSVAVVYLDEPATPPNTAAVYAGVFDTNDNPVFAAKQISPTPPSVAQLDSGTNVVLTGGNFLAAWYEDDLDASFNSISLYIGDNTFSPAGVIGTPAMGLTQSLTATSDNNLSAPVLFANTDGTTDLFTTLEMFDENNNYVGSSIIETSLGADGSFAGTQTTIETAAAPDEDVVTQVVPLSTIPVAAATDSIEAEATPATSGVDLAVSGVHGVSGADGLDGQNIFDLIFNSTNPRFEIVKDSSLTLLLQGVQSGQVNPDYLSAYQRYQLFELASSGTTTLTLAQLQQTPLPAFTVAASTSTTTNGVTTNVINISPPAGGDSSAYSLQFSTDPTVGTAVAGTNYTAITAQTINFTAGQTTPEQVVVTDLGSTSTALTFGYQITDLSSGAILDTDTGTIEPATALLPAFSSTSGVFEMQTPGSDSMTFTVTNVGMGSGTVEVSTDEGTSTGAFTQVSYALTLGPGQSTPFVVQVTQSSAAGTLNIIGTDSTGAPDFTASGTIPAQAAWSVGSFILQSLTIKNAIYRSAQFTVSLDPSGGPGSVTAMISGDGYVATSQQTNGGPTFYVDAPILPTAPQTAGDVSCTLSNPTDGTTITVAKSSATGGIPAIATPPTPSPVSPGSPGVSGPSSALPGRLPKPIKVTVNPSNTAITPSKLPAFADVETKAAAPAKPEPITLNLYAFPLVGTNPNPHPILLESKKDSLSAKTGRGNAVNFSVGSLPASMTAGTYQFQVEVVDSSGLVNLAAATQTLQVLAPYVQPVLAVGAVVPATIAVGKLGSVVVTVTNTGNIPAVGVDLTLSSATGGAVLAKTKSGARILPGKSVKFKLHFKVTSALAAGQYFPYVSATLAGVAATVTGTTPFTVG